ncbi:hypothetical protein THRCLA_22462 [Thraustotheca clavata]|uniref:LNR domain-containing protein n=1 Tax=Thraustotheca clavata TaxID=74557 RepID=A0A1V9Z0F0_9STRA|nr:hypothetical protein THRCLA_22462 [Thraustotheca clavata]
MTSTPDRAFLFVALFKYTVAFIYLGAIGGLMVVATKADEIKLQVYAMKSLCAPIYLFFAGLNLLGALSLIVPRRCFCFRSWMRRSCTTIVPQQKWVHFVVCFQACEILAQLLQAYGLSFYTVNPFIALGYTSLVGLAALLNAWPLLLPHHRRQGLLISSLTSFILATGFFGVVGIPPMVSAVIYPHDTYSIHWTTRNTLLWRYLLPNTFGDLVEKVLLFTMSWYNVQRLVTSATRTACIDVRTEVLLDVVKSSPSDCPSHTGTSLAFRNKMYGILAIFNISTGIFIGIVVATVVNDAPSCPKECIYSTVPWFSTQCHCIYYHYDCREHSSVNFTELLLTNLLGPDLFQLHYSWCPMQFGLNVTLLEPFHQLYGITIEFSNMTTWHLDPGKTWPASIMSINVRYSSLEYIPPALLTLPTYCQTLTIAHGSNITILPDSAAKAWANLAWLILNDNRLNELPSWVQNFTEIERLGLSTNNFSMLPIAALAVLPRLSKVELAQNMIQEFPTPLLAAIPSIKLDLSNNPLLLKFPISSRLTNSVASRKILLDGTNYCKGAESLDGCRPVCSRYCSNNELEDSVCQMNCYSEICQWDKNDCANGSSQ